MYSAFLKEAGKMLNDKGITEAALKYASIGAEWTNIAKIIDKAGDTLDKGLLNEVGERVRKLAEREIETLEKLA